MNEKKSTTYSRHIKKAARHLVEQGFTLIQLHPMTKVPYAKGWQGRAEAQASTIEDVERLWSDDSRGCFNIGIVMGAGLFVLDVDGEDGARHFRKIERKLGKLPGTLTVKTSSGKGWHRYYKYDTKRWNITNSRRGLAHALGLRAGIGREDSTAELLKIDIRGKGGQVVAPGCPVQNGDAHIGVSKVTNGKGREMASIADAPEWLLEVLTAQNVEQETFEITPISDRDYAQVKDALNFVKATTYDQWVRIGMAIHTTGRRDAFELFDQWSSQQYGYESTDDCKKHWRSFKEDNANGAITTYRTIFYDAQQNGWAPPAPTLDLGELEARIGPVETDGSAAVSEAVLDNPSGYSDDALAIRVANQFQERIRYVHPWKRWLIWNGTVWQHDQNGDARGLVRMILRAEGDVCRDLANQITNDPKSDKERLKIAAKLHQTASKLGMTNTLNNVIAQLTSEQRVGAAIAGSTELWDRNPEVLNTPVGPYDMRTGELLENAKDHHCTHHAKVAPTYGEPKRWLQFLQEVFPDDQEKIDYLQTYMGYASTGYTRENCLLMACGGGGNGKSVFFNIMHYLLGGYAKVVDPDLFTNQGVRQHKSALAALMGRRFILSQELPSNSQWNEARIKTLASGDVIEANFMFGEKFEFTPQGTIVICTNVKPTFKSVDDALRRRFKTIEFNQSFLGREDRTLPDKLIAEGSDILGWVMEGAKRYLQEGLKEPQGLKEETENYLNDADVLSMWMGEIDVPGDEINQQLHYHPLIEAYKNYATFAKSLGCSAVGKHTFTDRLQGVGIAQHRVVVERYKPSIARYWGPMRLETMVRH